MARKLFGTDGIRGRANSEPMTAEIALKVAMAAARQFRRGDHRHVVVIGKDTRLSGYMLEPAMTAGFISMGMDVILVGPIPTPAIGMLTWSLRADLGVMLSASHNPYEDNGIKLFGPDGYKLSDEIEAAIEHSVATDNGHGLADASHLGRARRLEDAPGRYIHFVKTTLPRRIRLDGLRIVVDCAHGAAYKIAPAVLYELGADVIPLGVKPDGMNINQNCGATSPAAMCEAVIAEKADIGIALDGDADRIIVADERGKIVDGDQLMALIATQWHKSGQLTGGGIVSTVMSNLGLEKYLGSLGLSLARTAVGDRYVVEHMREHQFNLGGEQSGHIILSDFSTTGDGLMAGLQVLAAIVEAKRPASDVCHLFEPYPQRLKNVRYTPGTDPLNMPHVQRAIKQAEGTLNGSGRVLIRKSGTEPLIRVMVESQSEKMVETVVEELAGIIQAAGTHQHTSLSAAE